jgi:hypothetical protein
LSRRHVPSCFAGSEGPAGHDLGAIGVDHVGTQVTGLAGDSDVTAAEDPGVASELLATGTTPGSVGVVDGSLDAVTMALASAGDWRFSRGWQLESWDPSDDARVVVPPAPRWRAGRTKTAASWSFTWKAEGSTLTKAASGPR